MSNEIEPIGFFDNSLSVEQTITDNTRVITQKTNENIKAAEMSKIKDYTLADTKVTTSYNHATTTNGSNPHNTTFENIAQKPTTLEGYGITDTVQKLQYFTGTAVQNLTITDTRAYDITVNLTAAEAFALRNNNIAPIIDIEIEGSIRRFYLKYSTNVFCDFWCEDETYASDVIYVLNISDTYNQKIAFARIPATVNTLAPIAYSGSYTDLYNKPTIPTVNDATLTIKKNGTQVGTFTANSSTNTDINITVPAVNNGTLTIKQGTTQLGTFTANQSTNSTITIPAAPTVGDGTITINQGGVQKGTFTVNQSGNTTINLDAGGGGGSSYTLPIATSSTLGGVKASTIDNGIEIASDGTLSNTMMMIPLVESISGTAYTLTISSTSLQREYRVLKTTGQTQLTITIDWANNNVVNEQYLLIRNNGGASMSIAFTTATGTIIQGANVQINKNFTMEFSLFRFLDSTTPYIVITNSSEIY